MCDCAHSRCTEATRAVHNAAPNIASTPAETISTLSMAIRPIVIIASPPKARSRGPRPHLRQAGVKSRAIGTAASIKTIHARNHREPGTLMPSGASRRTRHAGHFGITAKTIEEKEDDSVAETTGIEETRGTISPMLR